MQAENTRASLMMLTVAPDNCTFRGPSSALTLLTSSERGGRLSSRPRLKEAFAPHTVPIMFLDLAEGGPAVSADRQTSLFQDRG
ncbi:hypothetical protein NDU88_005506 [Pleurodeles waltl]|uniref:Uncharacterized protein n=1 Tax=Pleurodeles waltl TaxID=8319 RepID=A0AAV7L2N4_PLEWA|nr:hypothetical protein NDU88_005506 [Pleurodeles waltl]